MAEYTFKPNLGTGTFVWRKEIALQSYFHLILFPVLSTVNWRSYDVPRARRRMGTLIFVHVSV